jgi:hypothetical protein
MPKEMARNMRTQQPASTPAAASLEAELERIAAMNKDELRLHWRQTRKQDPPAAFSRDLLARALSYWLQEKHLGGLSPILRRQLAAAIRAPGSPNRHIKPGSVIVREYQGVVHDVMVVPDGFLWQGQTYSSLSTIARKITGTNWNGPRFFGLRGKNDAQADNLRARKQETRSSNSEPLPTVGESKAKRLGLPKPSGAHPSKASVKARKTGAQSAPTPAREMGCKGALR